MTLYRSGVEPAPAHRPQLERIPPGLWRHLATGRLLVKRPDGWQVAFDTKQGVLPEGPTFRTMQLAARSLARRDAA